MVKLLLSGTIGLVLALALGIAALATWCAASATAHFEHLRTAHEVRSQYHMLDSLSDDLLRAIAVAGPDVEEASLQPRLAARFEAIRQAHRAEIARNTGDPAEFAELQALATLELAAHSALHNLVHAAKAMTPDRTPTVEARFAAILAEGFGTAFYNGLTAAIARESAEIAIVEAEARDAIAMVSRVTQLGAVLVALVAMGSVLLLSRRLQRPLDRLVEAAEAVAAGDSGRRIEPASARGEFAPVARSFNAMIDHVARARAELEAARDALEATVAARTAELAAANATLRQADEARRRFLADVSHELRTPLTVMRGEAEIALRGAERQPEEYRRALTRIAEEAALTGHLVDELLFVARSEAGEARIARQPVSFDEVVRRAATAARTLAAPRQVRVVERACSIPVGVQGDPEKLRQLVLILLDNAVRYSEPGGDVTLTLVPGSDVVQLCVEDQGIGIPPEEIERVFERFHRSEGAAALHPQGSGLGLPLARAIARAHGGEVTVERRTGGGTLARLRLPLAPRMLAVA
jgi:signal transduction histidine kinase